MRFDDLEPATFVLVRHGETDATVARSLSGSGVPGPALNAAGRVQAARAADLVFRIGRDAWEDLPHPDAVVSSPLVRTRQTADAIGRRLGAGVRIEPRIAEADFGTWEGSAPEEIDSTQAGAFRRWHTDPGVRAPGGESLADVGARMAAVLTDLTEGNVGRAVVLVSHVMAIRAAVGWVLDAPPAAWFSVRVPPASLSVVRLWPDGARELVASGVPSQR